MPRNWRGRLSGRFDEITLSGGWPTILRGTLDMDGLIAPPPRNISIGSYHVVIPDPAATEAAQDSLTARVTDKEGPFSFEGRFTLGADRSFLLEERSRRVARRRRRCCGPSTCSGRPMRTDAGRSA